MAAYRLSQWSTPGRLRVEQGNGANLHRFSQDEAAERMAVSRRSVNYAGKVLSEDRPATAELRQALEEGLVRASDAAGVAEKPAEVQQRALDMVARKEARNLRAAVKQVDREMLLQESLELGDDTAPEPLGEPRTIHTATVAGLKSMVEPESVDAIITHPPSTTTTVQGGACGEARRAARRLAWERLARSLHSCVSSSHRSSSAGPKRSRGSISRTTR